MIKKSGNSTSQKLKADKKPEIYVQGFISHGTDFDPDLGGLSCEMQIIAGKSWDSASDLGLVNTHISFQTSKSKEQVWSQPFEFLFSPDSMDGWPFATIKVSTFDESNKVDVVAYGKFCLPKEMGEHTVTCRTWTPIGDGACDSTRRVCSRICSLSS